MEGQERPRWLKSRTILGQSWTEEPHKCNGQRPEEDWRSALPKRLRDKSSNLPPTARVYRSQPVVPSCDPWTTGSNFAQGGRPAVYRPERNSAWLAVGGL